MLSSRVMNKVLRDLQDITGTEFFLADREGAVLAEASARKPSAEEAAAAAELLENGENAGEAGEWLCRTAGRQYPELVLAARGSNAPMAVRIAAAELETLLLAVREKTDRGRFLQSVLLGKLTGRELQEEAGRLRMRDDVRRVVYLLRIREEDCETAVRILRAMLTSARAGDQVAPVDASHVAVIHELRGSDEPQIRRQLAHELLDTLNTEAMISVRIALGTAAGTLEELSRSCREARLALEITAIFMPDQRIADYTHLGTGQLIYQLPVPLCEKFLAETFPSEVLDELDEETMTTIRQFFANSLNISETARQMYLHRNTLVYRLEKLEKTTGLDIRKFEDAMTFRIAMMVHDCLRQTGYGQRRI